MELQSSDLCIGMEYLLASEGLRRAHTQTAHHTTVDYKYMYCSTIDYK